MNDTQIENLLRKAPRPRPPGGLRERLEADITLPEPAPPRRVTREWTLPSWRRWVPALSIGLVILACLVVLAVQTRQVLQHQRENDALRASASRMESLLEDQQKLQARAARLQELDQLRKAAAELEQLRAEAARLRESASTLATLQAENHRLKADLAARQAQVNAAAPPEEDPFAEARQKAQRIACVNNLKHVCLAARMWEMDHGQQGLPADVMGMTNYLPTPKVLMCPAAPNRPEPFPARWADFDPRLITYELVSPGADLKDPQVVFVRCPIHNNVGLVDGSVHQLSPADRIIEVNGRKYPESYVRRVPSPSPTP